MSAMAGDLPGFEEAARALFADDRRRMQTLVADWPDDVRAYALALAFGVLLGFTLPAILDGKSPVAVALVSLFAVAFWFELDEAPLEFEAP